MIFRRCFLERVDRCARKERLRTELSQLSRLFIVGAATWLSLAAPATEADIPGCTVAAIRKLAPAGVTIADIPQVLAKANALAIKTSQGVAQVKPGELGEGSPEFCYVTGTVVTSAKTGKTAHFAAALPQKSAWNQKFMFQGCGGNCGVTFPPNIASLRKGYPVWATDDGHVAKPSPGPNLYSGYEASWAISEPGKRDEEKVTDFYHRAVHAVSVAGKQFTTKYYDADKVAYSYMEGCSDGGREGMVALSRYPDDFDGIIAGAPYFDIANEMMTTLVGIHAQLRSATGTLSPQLFAAADRIIVAKCDASDGVTDGLIQDPARCAFSANQDLPRCASGSAQGTSGVCFTEDQIDALSIIFSAIKDPAGKVAYPGFPLGHIYNHQNTPPGALLADWLGSSVAPLNRQAVQPWSHDLAGQPQGWFWVHQTIANFVYDGASDFNALKTPGITFQREQSGATFAMHAVVPVQTINKVRERVKDGSGVTPQDAARFIQRGGKLIMYHGYSDGGITPYRTIQYYRELARLHGGVDALKKSARLFLVPGMEHCGRGPGPNVFGQGGTVPPLADSRHDIVRALEGWVERGEPPADLMASKYEGDDHKKRIVRTLPACSYPAIARYNKKGDVNDGANWTCSAEDRRLEEIGPAGQRAGVYEPLYH